MLCQTVLQSFLQMICLNLMAESIIGDIPLSIAYPAYGVGKAAYELFMLGYRNGYDSTR